jgi:hypothetical protein
LSVTTALAVSGALFAMFVESAPHTGYLLCLAITFGLAVLAGDRAAGVAPPDSGSAGRWPATSAHAGIP